ncbi:MAG: hypothetical protein V1754_06195 [Pseudomonadota bacterium]
MNRFVVHYMFPVFVLVSAASGILVGCSDDSGTPPVLDSAIIHDGQTDASLIDVAVFDDNGTVPDTKSDDVLSDTPSNDLMETDTTLVCIAMATAYDLALKEARSCNSMIDMEQCTLEVIAMLGCPCKTYVNPLNSTAIQAMTKLEGEWTSAGCTATKCPKQCDQPTSASCEIDSNGVSTGVCTDVIP